jgi:carboxymethylenebutenolidase
VDIPVESGGTAKSLRAYVVYPESKEKAPVVVVIQEIFGLTDWIRSVADQLAADGFIAIAPDLLTGKGPNGGNTDAFPSRDDVTRAVRGLDASQVIADLNAVREYGLKQPACNGKSASVGFCWGGGTSFNFAAHQPELNAAVVYYGTPPKDGDLKNVRAPVLGLYGGNDARVTSTVKDTEKKMKELGKPYMPHVYEGAGHGFLMAQSGSEANAKAAEQAWPTTIEFLKEHTK